MSRKPKPLTPDVVLAVIRHRGVFEINPYSWRDKPKMGVLKGMVAQGTLECVRPAKDRLVYGLKGKL